MRAETVPRKRDTTTIPDTEESGNLLDRLVPVLYDELRDLARRFLIHERRGHTLRPTALVHEVYIRLAQAEDLRWENRNHLVSIAARAMRHVLVNHAKARNAAKRGSGWQKVDLDGVVAIFEESSTDLLTIDEALEQLAEVDPLQARVVELRFFGGLTVEEAAEVLGCSKRTVEREWALARAWLRCAVAQDGPTGVESGESSEDECSLERDQGTLSACA